jgi:hypothetical protein
MKALVKLPSPGELLNNEAMPQDLRSMAAKYSSGGIEVDKLDLDEVRQFLGLTYELIARAVKYLAMPDSEAWDLFLTEGGDPSAEGWEPVTLTASFFSAEGDVDQADVDALAMIVGRQRTPNEVTVASKLDLGLMTPEEAHGLIAAEPPGGRVSDFAPFRQEQGGADGRPDGEDVRDPAIVSARGERPGSRVRRR